MFLYFFYDTLTKGLCWCLGRNHTPLQRVGKGAGGGSSGPGGQPPPPRGDPEVCDLYYISFIRYLTLLLNWGVGGDQPS
jgi:hypothetical protein